MLTSIDFHLRHWLIVIIIVLFTFPVHAVFIRNDPRTLTQPNGSKIDCFVTGDEFHQRYHDADNYTIISSPKTGYFCYAEQDGDNIKAGSLIVGRDYSQRSSLNPGINISKRIYREKRETMFQVPETRDTPSTGTVNNLVVFIRFADQSEFNQNISIYDGWHNTNTVSMKNYFLETSNNTLTVESSFYPPASGGMVVSWQDSHDRSYYVPYNEVTNPDGWENEDIRRLREFTLLTNCVAGIEQYVPTGFNIDANLDGIVDNITFIVAGSDEGGLLWPHWWAIYTHQVLLNGKRVYGYNLQLQDFLSGSSVGVLCHEFVHSLGSPDFYRYDDPTIDPVGSWDVMAGTANPPQHMNSYIKWKYMHWIAEIPVISTDQQYTLNPSTSTTNNVYRIDSPYSVSEYFVVEYRRKVGVFESSIPASGMLVWRINTLAGGNAGGPPDECYVYRPNGTLTVTGNINSANFTSDAGRTLINDSTNPSSFLSNGNFGGLDLSNIGSAGTTISFNKNTAAYTIVDLSTGPYTQGFESATFPPELWLYYKSGDFNFETVTYSPNPTCFPYAGNYMARYPSSLGTAGDYAVLASPKFFSFGNTNYLFNFSFWMYRDDGLPTNNDKIEVYLSSSISLTGNPQLLQTIYRNTAKSPYADAPGWYQYSYNLILPVSGYYNILFKGVSDAGFNMYIDNFYLEKTPYPTTRSEWIGAVSDAWTNAANWLNGYLPGVGQDIIIPSGTPHSPTIIGSNAAGRDLLIKDGAHLTIFNVTLALSRNATINGDMFFAGTTPKLTISGDAIFNNDAGLNGESDSLDVTINGNCTINSSSVFNMNMGNLKLTGNSSTSFICNAVLTTLNNLLIQKNSATVYLSTSIAGILKIKSNLTIASGANLTAISSYCNLDCNGDILATGDIWLYTGTARFGKDGTANINLSVNSFLNNVTIINNCYLSLQSNLRITGDLNFSLGYIMANSKTITIGGNWLTSYGYRFLGAGSTVVFNGTTDQTCSDVSFYNFILNKSSGKLIIPSSSSVVANSYDYTAGAIEVNGGSFWAVDLADINIKGSYILNGGSIDLDQDSAQNVDIDADITISSGTFSIEGGGIYGSDWAYTRNVTINISGGELIFNNTGGINLSETGHTLTMIATGGTIKVNGSFIVNRANFYLISAGVGCTVEMIGSGDANISMHVASVIRNLKINKTATRESVEGATRSTARTKTRDGETRSVTVTLTGNVYLDRDLIITAGYLDLVSYTCYVGNDYHQYAYLNMYNPSATLNVNNDVFLYSGCGGFVSAGTINAKRHWTNQAGAVLQLGNANTVNFSGTVNATLTLGSNDMWFGSVVINKTSGNVSLATGTQYFNVSNDLTVNTGISLFFKNSTVTIYDMFALNGNVYLEAGCAVSTYDLNLAGNLELTNGAFTVGHNFIEQSTATLAVNPGTFTIDTAYTGAYFNFGGMTYFDGGTFQITNGGMQFGATSQFDFRSGTLKLGWNFRAVDSNVFQMSNGTVEMIGARTSTIECSNGNYFYNLTLNKPSTSYSLSFETDVTVNNDLTVQGGNNSLGAHTLNVGRDLIINGNWLTASNSSSIINVGRNWTNNVGTNAFAEGTGRVSFISNQAATISTDTFYNVVINKTSTNINDIILTSGKTMTTNGYLDIANGCLNVAPGAVLDTNGSVTIEALGGLDLNSSGTLTTFKIAGSFYDEGDDVGTGIGLNSIIGTTLIFDGTGDQSIGADYTSQTMNLCNVTVNKSSGRVMPYNHMNFMGNFTLTSGEWAYATAGRTKNFYGNLLIDSHGVFSDSTGTSNLISAVDTNLKLIGVAKFGTFAINKTDSNNINLNGNAYFAGTTTISLTAGILNLNVYTLKYNGSLSIGANGKLNLIGGSILNVNDNSTLSVLSGGEFVSIGSISNPAMLTSDLGYYTFSTTINSYVGAQYTIFEKMGITGINIASRCGVDTTNVFRGCTFRNGIAGGTLLTMNCQQYLNIYNAIFPANTWGGSYNVSRTYATGSVTFRTYSGAFSGPAFHYTTNNSIFWATLAPPEAPTNLQISVANGTATITWDAVTGVTGYNIYRSFIPDVFTEDDWIGSTEMTSYGDESVSIYPKAFYMVRSYME